jgi:tetratricopeptide (TPR) repeat protein
MATKGMDAMRCALGCLTLFGSSLLLAGLVAPDACGAHPAPAVPAAQPADRELQSLLDKLSQLSDYIGKNAESPQVWRHQLLQADVLLRLAERTNAAQERDNWLRLAADAYYGAAVTCPEEEQTPLRYLGQLAEQIAAIYPASPAAAYASRQEIKADYARQLAKSTSPAKAQVYLCERLMRFAREHPRSPEAPKAAQEAAQVYESLGKLDSARSCYRYLADSYPDQPVGRKAGGSLWRLGGDGERVQVKLPLLFPAGAGEEMFSLEELRGKLVVIYFWSCGNHQVEEDFHLLKQITDRYQYRGVAVVYVNLDDPAKARAFLAGRLTSGMHVFQKGGLDSPVAERYGLPRRQGRRAAPALQAGVADGSSDHQPAPARPVRGGAPGA